MKVISIIIATFNAEKVLERCLKGLKLQKKDEVEILIIDGASTDHTVSIVKKNLGVVDIILSEPDRGIYDAWNKGIKLAHGKYIMFLGADDYLYPDAISSYLDFISKMKADCDIISAKSEFVDSKGRIMKVIGEKFSYHRHKVNMYIVHGTCLHNKILFERYGMFSLRYKVCADYEFFMRLENVNSAFMNKVVMKFYAGGASFSVNCLKETFAIRKEYKSVSTALNCFLFFKRLVGLYYKKLVFKHG